MKLVDCENVICHKFEGSVKDLVSILRKILHVVFVMHHVFIGIYAVTFILTKAHGHQVDKVRELFLCFPGFGTNWNFVFQTVFLSLALIHDALEWVDKENSTVGTKLRYWRDVLFNGLVVPYTCFVFGMFWIIYAIDRELVFPVVYDDVIPWWFNHCVHTNILVMVVLETFLQARRGPTNFKLEMILVGGVGLLYAVVYYSIYFFAHRWLYNVFAIMTWWQVCLFQTCIWGSSFVFYSLHFPLNRLFHGPEPEMEKKNVPKESGEMREIGEMNGEIGSRGELEKSWSANYRVKRGVENSNL